MTILRNASVHGETGCWDIAVSGGIIREVCRAGGVAGSAGIECAGSLVFPGLINSHDHLEFNCYAPLDGGPYRNYVDWSESVRARHAPTIETVEAIPLGVRVRMGLAKNFLCGITSVVHHGSPVPVERPFVDIIDGGQCVHSPRFDDLKRLLVWSRRRVIAHVGEGTDAASESEIDRLLRWNLWRRRLIAVHGIAMRPDQAKRFEALIWCPVSNEFLYRRTAPIGQLKQHTAILFGTDSTISASWSIWDHIRRAREIGALDDGELIASLTTSAAQVWGLPVRGRIAVGAAADLVLARTSGFFDVRPENILLVLKDGNTVVADPAVQPDAPGLHRTIVNGVEKRTAENFAELMAAIQQYIPATAIPVSGATRASSTICTS